MESIQSNKNIALPKIILFDFLNQIAFFCLANEKCILYFKIKFKLTHLILLNNICLLEQLLTFTDFYFERSNVSIFYVELELS